MPDLRKILRGTNQVTDMFVSGADVPIQLLREEGFVYSGKYQMWHRPSHPPVDVSVDRFANGPSGSGQGG